MLLRSARSLSYGTAKNGQDTTKVSAHPEPRLHAISVMGFLKIRAALNK